MSKFVSIVLTLMVCLGLMLVPAMTSAQPASGMVGMEAVEAVPGGTSDIKVEAGGSFDVNVTIVNPDTVAISAAGMHIDFDPGLLNITGMTLETWDSHPLANWTWWDNATGKATCEGFTLAGGISLANFVHCTVNFESTGVESDGTGLNFSAASAGPIFTKSSVLDTLAPPAGPNELLDWSAVQNATVIIGTAKLKVDVNPVGTGSVEADGTLLVMDVLGCNTTTQAWSPPPVSLEAFPVQGWAFLNWTGDISGNPDDNPSDVSIDGLWNNVTANFVELPSQLWVSDNELLLPDAREGQAMPVSGTIQIKNTGGGTLNWQAAWVPTWAVDDSWLWGNSYWDGVNGTPTPNTVFMVVTDDSDANNYTAFAQFSPPALRVINSSGMLLDAQMLNGTVLVEKSTLDVIQQDANLLVDISGTWVPASATVTWSFFDVTTHHGWPYSFAKLGLAWGYTVTTELWVDGVKQAPESPTVAFAALTNYTNVIPAAWGGALLPPLPGYCWEITHFVNKTDPTSTTTGDIGDPACAFKVEYWSDAYRNFVTTIDGGTYEYPPMDVRSLLSTTWLLSPTSGSLTTGVSQDLTVTAAVTGLPVGTYQRSFNVTGSGTETVEVTLKVLPATTTPVERNLPGNKDDLNATYPGMTFDVYVNFTAPFYEMNAISLTDLAPDGWEVAVDRFDCLADGTPADYVRATGNKVEVTWWGDPLEGFAMDTEFSALYQVTVPVTAKPGINKWPLDDGSKAWAEYYEGEAGPYTSNVTDEYRMMITVPGYATGETRDVNAKLLPDTTVVLRNTAWVGTDESTPDYSIECRNTGVYWLRAIKDAYYTVDSDEIGGHPLHNANHTEDINWSTAELLANSYHPVDGMNHANLDFEGDYGLVPQSCTMSYAMKSVNLYVFSPAPIPDIHNGVVMSIDSFGLNQWKAARSIMSWQNPYQPFP